MGQLNLEDLSARLGRLGVTSPEPLGGGASSLTFKAHGTDRPVVVKVAPPDLPPILHRDVLRQARILRALRATPVPVPEVLAEDLGDPPAVPPLFVMTFRTGESIEPLFDLDGPPGDAADAPVAPVASVGDAVARVAPAYPDGSTMAARMEAAAEVMAALHRLDPGPAGLGLVDEPAVGAAAEIDRWCRLLATVDPALVPGWEAVAAALGASLPAPVPPALVHGDFRLGNLLATGTRITTVIDWEIWSVGDPRLDVGWFLANADPATYRRPTRYARPGLLPSLEALARTYGQAVGREVSDPDWFVALARFKSAATWSLIVKHNRRRPDPDPDIEAMAPVPAKLLHQAREQVA